MSSVKSLCKAAREALDRGDASTALKLCEAGLAIEPNYMLLVFKALSLQNLGNEEDSLASYRMASKLEPEQALAWQVVGKECI
jgi:Tfp pilus assembly protein PilF